MDDYILGFGHTYTLLLLTIYFITENFYYLIATILMFIVTIVLGSEMINFDNIKYRRSKEVKK